MTSQKQWQLGEKHVTLIVLHIGYIRDEHVLK